MRIQTLALSSLNPATYNPRKELRPGDAEFEKLKRSIDEFGYVELIVVNSANNNTVISGHQRLSVMKTLGIEEAQCVVVELDETREKALNIAMNKISGEWDESKLALLIADLDAADFDAELTGFDEAEIQAMIGSLDEAEAHDDGFDLDAALEQAAFVEPGDVWTVGRHRLMCADATQSVNLEALMGGKCANLLLTDPPYNVDFQSSKGLSIKNDKMDADAFYQFLLDSFTAAAAVMAPGASAYVFHADTEGLAFRRAFIDAGFKLSGCCIWVKDSLVLGRSPYQWQHEPCLFGWKSGGKHAWYADRKQTTIWQFAKPKRSKNHPTSKPVDLMAYPMGNSTQPNAIVLDPFAGSGSTLIAAEQTDRVAYCMELDPKYASVILRRYVEHTGDAAGVWCERGSFLDLVKQVENAS